MIRGGKGARRSNTFFAGATHSLAEQRILSRSNAGTSRSGPGTSPATPGPRAPGRGPRAPGEGALAPKGGNLSLRGGHRAEQRGELSRRSGDLALQTIRGGGVRLPPPTGVAFATGSRAGVALLSRGASGDALPQGGSARLGGGVALVQKLGQHCQGGLSRHRGHGIVLGDLESIGDCLRTSRKPAPCSLEEAREQLVAVAIELHFELSRRGPRASAAAFSCRSRSRPVSRARRGRSRPWPSRRGVATPPRRVASSPLVATARTASLYCRPSRSRWAEATPTPGPRVPGAATTAGARGGRASSAHPANTGESAMAAIQAARVPRSGG